MIMQQGTRAFDPSTKVGKQMIETLRAHTTLSKQQIKQELIHYMTYMKLKDPQSLLKAYPYMLSGGMLQRMMIALALALKPKLIIADEPTTALDTITQYEVINAFKDIKHHFDCAMIFISHDLTVINKIADRVVVMREGRVIEEGRTNMVLQQPRHHYTAYLLSTKKTIYDYFQFVLRVISMLKVQNVIKFYGKKSMFRDKRIPVVKGVSFDCPTGASVAIIGEVEVESLR